MRIRIDVPAPGSYTVIHPYGTNLFTVQGKVHPVPLLTPLTVDAVTYSSNPGSIRLNVFATAPTTALVTCDICPDALVADPASDKFFASFEVAALPASVLVTSDNSAANPLSTPTTVAVNPQDVVTVTQADYDRATGTLTVSATSSDRGTTPPTLTIDLGGIALTGGTGQVTGLNVAPATVTVSSSAVGSDSEPVKVINPAP